MDDATARSRIRSTLETDSGAGRLRPLEAYLRKFSDSAELVAEEYDRVSADASSRGGPAAPPPRRRASACQNRRLHRRWWRRWPGPCS